MKSSKENLLRKSVSAVALALAFSPASANGEETGEDGYRPTTVDAPLVIVVKGKILPERPDGKVSFSINPLTMPWDHDKVKESEYAAVIFNGTATPGRQCPHIDSVDRERSVTGYSLMDVQIVTTASADEVRAVKEAGCMITKRVTYRSITWKHN